MQHLKKFNEGKKEKDKKKSQEVTKVLLVTGGDDYHAQSFEDEYGGTSVSEIIENLSKYESDEWDLEVFTFGQVDPKFVEFIKEHIQDYDQSKTTNFYLDTDEI